MGMDVYGRAPRSERGQYFRANVWSWHPIWEYCCFVITSTTSKVRHGHTNDGDGLGDEDARKLGELLQQKLDSGDVATYLERGVAMAAEPCSICDGTGRLGMLRDGATGHDPLS